jgi:hypothetical protein
MPIHFTYRDIAKDRRYNAENGSPRFPLQKADNHADEPDYGDCDVDAELYLVMLIHRADKGGIIACNAVLGGTTDAIPAETLWLFEIAHLLVRFYHVARSIVNANHSIM